MDAGPSHSRRSSFVLRTCLLAGMFFSLSLVAWLLDESEIMYR